MRQIAEDRYIEIFDGSFTVANRESVQQSLRWMLVRAVPCVDHGNVQMSCNVIRRARSCVAHHQAIWLHRIQIKCGVEQRLTLFQAGGLGLKIHGICAEPRSRRTETDAGTRGSFEKRQRYRFSA